MKKCSICKKIKALSEFNTFENTLDGLRSECKKCQYARQSKRLKKNRHKDNAKCAVKYAVINGKLQKPSLCEHCGQDKPLDGHHPDYEQRLLVVWLCRKCHSWVHARQRELLTTK